MFCNLECILDANDSDSHIYILEMLLHLKMINQYFGIFLNFDGIFLKSVQVYIIPPNQINNIEPPFSTIFSHFWLNHFNAVGKNLKNQDLKNQHVDFDT